MSAPSKTVELDPRALSVEIKAEALHVGFDAVGIVPATSPAGFDDLQRWLKRGFDGEMSYISRRETAYEHPQHVMPSVKSVVMLALNYHTDERASLFCAIGALFLDPGGNGEESRYRDSLDAAIGRWTRRKVRGVIEETNVAAIRATDHGAWGSELRAMAAAQAIDRNGGDLRSVLRALLVLENQSETEPNFEGAEIATLASTSESARRLLSRITRMLCEKLEHAR